MPKSKIVIETTFPQDLDNAVKMLATPSNIQEDISRRSYEDISRTPKAVSDQSSFIAKIESEVADKFLRYFDD